MLKGRDQWYNEGQPVMRHLREFETINSNKDCYCLFIAPSLHQDTINTYHTSVKYEYDGAKQKIIPITIAQLIEILKTVYKFKVGNIDFKHEYIKKLYDDILEVATRESASNWISKIPESISEWQIEMNLLVA